MADDCTGDDRLVSDSVPGRSRAGLLRRLLADKRAAQVIEYALVGPVLLLVVCTVMELGVLLLEAALLDRAAHDASRLIQTLQINATGEATFQSTVCNDLSTVILTTTCAANLQIRVQSASTFGAIPATNTTDANGNMTNTGFNPGGPGSDVLVQVGYSRPFVIPWMGQFMGKSGKLLLLSTVAFQNEL